MKLTIARYDQEPYNKCDQMINFRYHFLIHNRLLAQTCKLYITFVAHRKSHSIFSYKTLKTFIKNSTNIRKASVRRWIYKKTKSGPIRCKSSKNKVSTVSNIRLKACGSLCLTLITRKSLNTSETKKKTTSTYRLSIRRRPVGNINQEERKTVSKTVAFFSKLCRFFGEDKYLSGCC